MPRLQPPSRHPPARLTEGKIDCPRCGCRFLNPTTLVCACSAEFTVAGLEYWRTLPLSQAIRSD